MGDGSGGWDRSKQISYSYDHRDRLLLEEALFFDNPQALIGSTTTAFDYNRNGFLTQKALTLTGNAPG